MKKSSNKKMSQDDMRLMNNLLVLKILREDGPESMAELSKKTMLTLPSISTIISELQGLGLVRNSGMLQAKRGRFPSIYQFDGDSYYIISLAIRSDSISAGLVNLEGKILEVLSEPITQRKDPEYIMDISSSLIEKLVACSHPLKKDILGLGVSMHGIVDPIRGISIYPAQFHWRDYPFIDKLRERFPFPVKMDNDMNCLLLAEKWFGRAKGIESFVMIHVGYGVGTSIMTHDTVLRGEDFGAGQIGHISIDHSEVQCDCGKIGCLEAIASEKAILRTIIEKINNGRTSELLHFTGQDTSCITMEHVYQAANAGDALAMEAIQQSGQYLGKGIAILVNILNPRMIIVAGGILRSKEIFFTAFQEAIHTYALPTNVKNLEIYPSQFKEHSDIVGAATLWIEALFTGKTLLGQTASLE